MTASTLRWILPFLVIALGIQFGFRLFVRPAKQAALLAEESRVARLGDDLRSAEASGGDGDRKVAEVARADLDRQARQVEILRGVLSAGQQAQELLDSLAAAATEEGLRMRRFAPEPAFSMGPFTARSAAVEAEGNYFDFVRFFERVAGFGKAIVIDDFELSAPAEPGGALSGRFVAVVIGPESVMPEPADEGR